MVTTLVIFSCLVGIFLTASCVLYIMFKSQLNKCDELKADVASLTSQLTPVPVTHEFVKKYLSEVGFKVEDEEYNGWVIFEEKDGYKYLFRQSGVMSEWYFSVTVDPSVYDYNIIRKLCNEQFRYLVAGQVRLIEENNEISFYLSDIQMSESHFMLSFGQMFNALRGLADMLHVEYDRELKSQPLPNAKTPEVRRGPLN